MAVTKTRSDLKREAIIDAAKQAFQAFGVAGTSMDKLAEMAKVSKRTVYNHFCNKEELVMYILREQWEAAVVDIDIEYRQEASLLGQLEALLLAEINLVSSDEYLDLARVAIGYFFYDTDRLQAEIAYFQAQETGMQRWLKAAKADRQLVFDDVEQVVNEVVSLIKGQCFWPQVMKIEPIYSEAKRRDIANSAATLILARYATDRQEL